MAQTEGEKLELKSKLEKEKLDLGIKTKRIYGSDRARKTRYRDQNKGIKYQGDGDRIKGAADDN